MGLDGTVWLLEPYGPVAPALSVAPIHFPEVRTTDGLGIEEGTTNLITNPTVELNGNGWTTRAGANLPTSVTASTARALSGTQSLRVVCDGSQANQGYGTFITGASASTAHTGSLGVFVESGDCHFIMRAETSNQELGSGNIPRGQWLRFPRTLTTGGSAEVISVQVRTIGTAAPAVFHLDAAQIEAKPYATSYCDGSLGQGYAWTGAAHASASTRTAGRVLHPLPLLRPPFTLSVLWRVGNGAISTPYLAAITGGTASPALGSVSPSAGGSGNQMQFTSSVDVNAVIPITSTPGDVMFGAGTLDASGRVYTAYGSRNGGALIASAPSAASGTAFTGGTFVDVGALNGASYANSAYEQLLIHNRVLSPAEVTALATGGPVDYPDDPSIVYATGTKTTRGSLTALTAAGTGLYRNLRSLPANVDRLSDFDSAPYAFGTGATHRVSLPPGSGVGAGAVLSTLPGLRLRVLSVYAPGGVFDEAYCAPA